ncbi:MAG TPA: hypothetical protein VFR84_19155 [Candidatus Angelobacter sp.]|nr:hypothetical protein [Candidatus Angelobacter sp.]
MTVSTTPASSTSAAAGKFDEQWLHDLYRECGREITLAYTTQNQLTNWAILVVGALFPALAFGAAGAGRPTAFTVIGLSVAYAFVLRFFFRAILAYINLSRWNTLQKLCLRQRLFPGAAADPDAEAELARAIENHYFHWISPINRREQVVSTLRLSFSLLFVLPLFFLLWGFIELWNDSRVPGVDIKGVAVFVVGITGVEIASFLRSSYFDDIAARNKRKNPRAIFPAASPDTGYIVWWLTVLVASIVIALWRKIF